MKRGDVVGALLRARENGWRMAVWSLRNLVVGDLSWRQRQVYEMLHWQEPLLTEEVCERLGISSSNANNVLAALEEAGLARREPEIRDVGLRYKWYLIAEAGPEP